MQFIADFHIHSKYSIATGREMDIPHIARSAAMKGIALVGTGDFTHPEWMKELRRDLEPADNDLSVHGSTHFILTTEVNNTYRQGGRARRIHNNIFAPSLEVVEKITRGLAPYGKLASDGRPTLSISSQDLVKLVFDASDRAFVVPSHIWTPWFSLYGSNSGFDRIEECFGPQVEHIFSLETGLSSDPAMNWRISALDSYTLMSNSDAHSPTKLGREANVFDCELSYDAIREVLKTKDASRFLYTIEFFPQEGKYHYDGHRKCNARVSPRDAMLNNDLCPICGTGLTVGVLHRVETLADRAAGYVPEGAIPFRSLIPLEEILGESLGVGVGTVKVAREYERLIGEVGTEFSVLLDVDRADIERVSTPRVAEAIARVRSGDVEVLPGYDGVFGEIRIFPDGEAAEKEPEDQMALF
ncbi:DNA helicase UvrD [candidate division TA06 bacterium SM1_40]|uniref:DNA helicase UvrD n=1 Tax=candidate division TA06 bacterium SM1_40 TaxID=1703773 RepID=A0A0S8JLV2_UNCT6|nr:MAG: DNA helicase UvrD [candidate division TA06 bacterium SM1_40]